MNIYDQDFSQYASPLLDPQAHITQLPGQYDPSMHPASQGALAEPSQGQQAGAMGMLQAPTPYEAPYDESAMRDPRKMMWAGLLSDVGNYIGSGGRQPMQGLGMKMYQQTDQYNNRLKAANQAGKRQHWQDQNQYAGALHTQGVQNRQVGQGDERIGLQKDQVQALKEYRLQQAEAAAEQARSTAAHRTATLQNQQDAADWRKVVDTAGAEAVIPLGDGRSVRYNNITGETSEPFGKTTTDKATSAAALERYVAGEQADESGGMQARQAADFRQIMERGDDFNIGGPWERGANRVARWTTGTETQRNTDKLESYLNQFTLENAEKLSGAISDADIKLLAAAKPTVDTDERVMHRFLYDVEKSYERQAILQQARRQAVESGAGLGSVDERGIVEALQAEHDKQYGQQYARGYKNPVPLPTSAPPQPAIQNADGGAALQPVTGADGSQSFIPGSSFQPIGR